MTETLSPALMDRFYRRALQFQYWQTHQEALGQIVEQDLSTLHSEMPLAFQPKEVRHANKMQIVQLQYESDVQRLLHVHLSDVLRAGDRLKILAMGDGRWMALRLTASGLLEVETYTGWAMIEGADLVPLEPLTKLTYSSQLDLMPQVVQWVETAPLTSARFQIVENGVQGQTIRGYTFQKYEALAGGTLAQHAELFFALKKIERLFVQPESDPFYQELVSLLEKSYNMLSAGHPEAQRMAEAAIAKGQQALKSVFPNDKLLLLLVTNIEFLLTKMSPRSPGRILREKS